MEKPIKQTKAERWSNQQTRQVVDTLRNHGATKPCSRCGNDTWAAVPRYIQLIHTDTPEPAHSVLEGFETIPCIGEGCQRCGFLSLHLVQLLEVVPATEDNRGIEPM